MDQFEKARGTLLALQDELGQLEHLVDDAEGRLLKAARDMDLGVQSTDDFRKFMDKPYILRPMRSGNMRDRWELIIPSFIGFRAGWPVRREGNFDIFMVSKFIDLITPLPDWLRKELGIDLKEFEAFVEGSHVIVENGDPVIAWEKLGGSKNFSARRGNKFSIIGRRKFDTLRALVREGVLPYRPSPIPEDDLRPGRGKVVLRSEQARDYETLFLQYSCGSLFAKGGAGKTFFSLYAADRLKGRKAVFAPRTAILDQWKARVQLLLPGQEREWDFATYRSVLNGRSFQDYALVIFDEAQTLPSNSGIRASQINSKARLCLSATPWREDGLEDIIPALGGIPFGMDWPTGESAKTTLWLCDSEEEKIRNLKHILSSDVDGKTLIYVYRLEIGHRLAKILGVPFVYGGTPKQLEAIQKADTCVVSKIGDAGISMDVRRLVEFDWLGGRQELGQRGLRGSHAQEQAEFHLLWTKAEYRRFSYRLTALSALQFDLKVMGADGDL